MQHCLLVFGPPNLGLSRQLTHLAQSSSIKQPLHRPQRRDRTPPGAYWLSVFLFLNRWPFLLPLLLRWMCSWEATHWTLPWSASSSSSSSSSSAMSVITEQKSWVESRHYQRTWRDVWGRHLWMPKLTNQSARHATDLTEETLIGGARMLVLPLSSPRSKSGCYSYRFLMAAWMLKMYESLLERVGWLEEHIKNLWQDLFFDLETTRNGFKI